MWCRLVRWRIAGALDREGPPSRRVERHLAGCASCQAFAADLESLHRRLASGVRAAPRPIDLPARRRRPALAAGAVLVLAGSAALALMAWPATEGARTSGRSAPAVGERPAAPATLGKSRGSGGHSRGELAALVDSAAPDGSNRLGARPLRSGRGLVDQVGRLFAEPRPLRAELDALAADGRRGARAILSLGGVRGWAK